MSMESLLDRVKGVRYITVKGVEYDLYEELSVQGGLQKVFEEHTEKALFWARVHDEARSRLGRLEDNLKREKAKWFIEYQHAHEERNRVFTDALIWAHVNRDENTVSLEKEVRLSRKRVSALKTVCDAFEHRKSMLMQLGALHRREGEELAIRKRRS